MSAPDMPAPYRQPAAASEVFDPQPRLAELAEFRRLRALHQLSAEAAARLATQAAHAFMERQTAAGEYLTDAVRLLCELASLDDPSLARLGVQTLFTSLVEPLGDAFTAAACVIYDRLFAQVIQHCREQPDGIAIDRQLRHFGLVTETDLLRRALRIRSMKRLERARAEQIQKAFVLSRVTLGADVAVTSVVLAALQEALPKASIGLVANAKSAELFAGDPRVQLCAVEYPRGGGLIERLTTWQHVVTAIQHDSAGLDPSDYVIIDPDSRLTQLGLLPLVVDDSPYLFFESRSYAAPGLQKIGALTAHWLQRLFNLAGPLYPYCAPAPQEVAAAKRLVETLKRQRSGPIVAVNLGVGANPAKRLSTAFELRLLARLMSAGATVFLDKGADPEEVARIEALVAALRAEGFRTWAMHAHHDAALRVPMPAAGTLMTWQGGIGSLAALIGESAAYIGYDSAGQHIAAALGVPTIDLFTGFTSPRMPERWSPHGRGAVHVLVLADAEGYAPTRQDALVDAVLVHVPLAG
jgi:ADP-heptose:LPS heptosyltransferase